MNKEMPNYFYKGENNKIIFYYHNKQHDFSKSSDSSKDYSRIKVTEGINHMLTYLFEEQPDDYKLVCDYISKSFTDMIHDVNVVSSSQNYKSDMRELFVKWSVPTDEVLDIVYHYVSKFIDEDTQVYKTNDPVLNNEQGFILTMLTITTKLAFVNLNVIKGKTKFSDTISIFVDALISKIIDSYTRNNGNISSAEVHSNIDNYISFIVTDTWNKNTNESYRKKFLEIGKDYEYYVMKNKVSLFDAFVRYVPPVIDVEVASKYKDKVEKSNIKDIYFTIGKDYRDFRYINKNLFVYIKSILNRVVRQQNLNLTFDFAVNTHSIMDTSEESSLKKDILLLQDRYKHVFETRRNNAEGTFKIVTQGLAEYHDEDIMLLRNIKVSKEHYFNNFILHKILLSLCGESKIYVNVLGEYSVFFLILFYLRIRANEEDFPRFQSFIDIILMECTSINMVQPEDIEKFLKEEGMLDIQPKAFSTIIKLYKSDDDQQIFLEPKDFLEFYKFMDNPSNIRQLLFPKIYDKSKEGYNSFDGTKYKYGAGYTSDSIQGIVDIINKC